MKLTHRQGMILNFITKYGPVANNEIGKYIAEKRDNVNRSTIVRDLDVLVGEKYIIKTGQGRNTKYTVKDNNYLTQFIDPKEYFSVDFRKREIKKTFNFKIFQLLLDSAILALEEISELEKMNQREYIEKVADTSIGLLRREIERLLIDFSWKSSQIEGNTYSMMETEALIKEKFKAKGHTKEEVNMIIGHKNALEYVLENKKEFKNITVAKLENIHKLLVNDLGIAKNIRQRLIGIGGTRYRPLDNECQIKEALENVCQFVNNDKIHPLVKAMMSILLISYIQPFEDGNKRTARLIGNAILLAHNYCPLSYQTVDVMEYKKAVLLFYEQNNISYFKKIFLEQFDFAVNEYFL
jgi:Fic family protein